MSTPPCPQAAPGAPFGPADGPAAVRAPIRPPGADSGRVEIATSPVCARAALGPPNAPEARSAPETPARAECGPAIACSEATLHALADLAAAIVRAREKHPKGCNLRSLVEEVGEVANAMRRTPERVREELLDTCVVALRLYLGEWCEEDTVEALRKRIADLETVLRHVREHEEARPEEVQSMYALSAIDGALERGVP